MPIKKFLNSNLQGFKLIVASAAVGNVSQLASDLIIETLGLDKYGMLLNNAIIPLIGPPTFSKHSDMTTAAEFFISEAHKFILLQTRTPLYNNYYDEFSRELIDFIKSEGISELVIITSTFSYEQHSIEKSPFEFVKNDKFDAAIPSELFMPSTDLLEKELPGSGIALELFKKATENEIKSIVLYKYVSEGDNRQDALSFLMRLNVLLNNPISDKIREPPSWKFMFGNSVRAEIY